MRQLSAYVARSVLASLLGVLAILVGIDALTAFINESGSINANYTYLNVMTYIGMTVPSRIYEFIPFASLIGCLIGLGALAGNSELVIMRASGVSLLRIVWFVIRPTLLVIFVGVMLAEYLVPYADQSATTYKALKRSGSGQVEQKFRSNLWNKEGTEFMHFNIVAPGGELLYGVTRYQFDDQRNLKQASFSESAVFRRDHWVEENVAITHIEPNRTHVEQQVQRRWQTDLSPKLLNLISIPKESLSIGGLHSYARYLQDQGQDSQPLWLEFWGKVLQPLSVLSLVLVAISFIFGPLRQVTMGFRVFTGVIFGMTFWISQKMLGPSSLVYEFPPVIAVLVPIAVFMLIGALLLRRAA
ncbi:LPS export ABC transporter permease LptG [Porticoccus sp. W117]|uniref:LPS export ABC transporter permease LptG n=1 Tax=Porticoccus sp. W117 TaxID=3054777 RepID=UPI00259A7144|nr:LPS export ABC transporter permease LptG [Porticoccus sp. W117]MDM3869952.1 LPS export ABC transporter permease LptG [Porticoccus sp. W117]